VTDKNPHIDDPDFPPKTRANAYARLPYGYQPTEADPCVLEPNPEMAPLIKEALDYIDSGGALRETAAWLTEKTGVRISHQGINRIWRERRGADPKNEREKKQKKQRQKQKPKTGPDKKKAQIKRKASDAKRILTMQEKKLQNWVEPEEYKNGKKAPDPYPTDSISDTLDHEAEPAEQRVVFKPNPGPQTEFLAAPEQEILYGGSAGGGKSYALLADPMRYFDHPSFAGIIFRRTNDELRELIWKSQELYPQAFPGAKWQERKSQWVFPNGGRLWLTYLERDEDVLRYQGQSFSYIAFDEITQYPTSFPWDYMRSRLRTTAPDLPVYQRATSNPGGPGHSWVKKMFVDPAPAGQPYTATNIETGQPMVYPDNHEKAGQPLFQRRFIPASLYDNPYLTQDTSYEASLLSLPEMQRRQLLEGDWTIAEGAAFSEFRAATHVCDPFEIPENWRRFRSCDYGYSSYSAVHWFAIDPAYETLFIYRELYVSKHTGKDLAKAVLDAEKGERIDYGVLDSSAWHQRGQVGPSIAEEMISMGCRWRPSDRSNGARVSGKNRLHELLKLDETTGVPGIVFFNTCRQIIADLPVIPADPKGSDDIDPKYQSDHAYDSIRYGVMSRPRAFSPFSDGTGVPTKRWRPAVPQFGY
jgi:hypothetical protein